jgi:hypothetical protein
VLVAFKTVQPLRSVDVDKGEQDDLDARVKTSHTDGEFTQQHQPYPKWHNRTWPFYCQKVVGLLL